MENCVVLRDLDREIAEAEKRVAELDRLRADAAARLAELSRLGAACRVQSPASHSEIRSPASKLRLFRELFVGRQNVFAVRWENRARARSGYAPRCANEWRPGVCGKPKIRCGACDSQAFVALDDRAIIAHLRGHQVIGIYPLLPDDTCRLLAIDLDGSSWQSDARAIRTTSRLFDLEPAIERSRSGNGAHVWFFFADAVSATDARKLGFMLLTRTMADGAVTERSSFS